MQTKLTLRLDDHLIERAKMVARQRNRSLSQLVADYLSTITKSDMDKGATQRTGELPRLTSGLQGLLRDAPLDETDYYTYLEDKHL